MNATLNITSRSSDWRAYVLCNFTAFPFLLDDVLCASVEGLIQGIKYAPGDPRREEAFSSWGMKAKKLGQDAKREWVWWGDKRYKYGSSAHHRLIARALRAKFKFN